MGRLSVVALAIGVSAGLLFPRTASAQTNDVTVSATSTSEVVRLPEVVVIGRESNLVGVAESASQGTTGQAQLEDRPILRSGEILEAVPGVIITQHAGGGKANQYFLRGFNLDHGTDFAVFLDDMPLNLPSHAHGEGYSDMNTVIPEFVQRVDYEKGPYYADVGNYGSAGSAHLAFYKVLPKDFVTIEGGMYGYERGVAGFSQKLGQGNLLYGGEVYHDDGPWVHPDDYSKYNGLLTYSEGNDANGYSVTARGYHGKWNSSDQIPESAVPEVGFFGAISPTDGGNSQRYSLQGEWHGTDGGSDTKITAYGFYYDLDLFSDFTYFLTDPNLGDQFEQEDKRVVAGLDARHTIFNEWWGHDVQNTFGLQVRNDWIDNGLYQTADRVRVDKVDSQNGGSILPATTEADDFTDTQAGFWLENKVQWMEKFRSVAAIRGDIEYFDVTCLNNPVNSGTAFSALPSPKLSLIFGPWAKTEYYVQGGFDFHSNDGRGATQTVEPISADNPNPNTPSERIPGLVQTKGGEVGVRTLIVPHTQSTFSLWYLYSDSELQQDGDTGSTVASKSPSQRYGIELANYYKPTPYLAFDADYANSIARFVNLDTTDVNPATGKGGYYVPEAVGSVVSAGVTVHELDRISSSLRLRYFGPRNLTADGQYKSSETIMLNWEGSYQINKTWRISAEVLNLLDRRDHDIDYAYTYRQTPTAVPASGQFGDVFHPVEPIQARVGLTAQF